MDPSASNSKPPDRGTKRQPLTSLPVPHTSLFSLKPLHIYIIIYLKECHGYQYHRLDDEILPYLYGNRPYNIAVVCRELEMIYNSLSPHRPERVPEEAKQCLRFLMQGKLEQNRFRPGVGQRDFAKDIEILRALELVFEEGVEPEHLAVLREFDWTGKTYQA